MVHLREQVSAAIREHQLLKPGQQILAAVSGGVDSMVLLDVLSRLAREEDWKLTVAHVNHQLRGPSSLADERLVRRTARQRKLPIAVLRANVRELATRRGISLEMAAREIRHDFLARTARHRRIRCIALAHHQDDQLEHFFLRLLRGSGGQGLAGMKWVSPSPSDRDLVLVRPLLDCTKEALREYATEAGLKFREDSSNASLDIQRNRIRHELLPLLRRRYQPGLARSILRSMSIIGAESDLAKYEAERWLRVQGCSKPQSNSQTQPLGTMKRVKMPRSVAPAHGVHAASAQAQSKAANGAMEAALTDFEQLPVAVQRRVIQMQLLASGISAEYELVEHLREHPDKPIEVSGEWVQRKVGFARFSEERVRAAEVVIRLIRNGARVERMAPFQDFQPGSRKLNLKKPGTLNWHGVKISWCKERMMGLSGFKKGPASEYFDADSVGGMAIIRHWQEGDRFQPIGMRSATKLQDLFTNQKLERRQRRLRLVAEASSGELFWVEGMRISERFKLTPHTIRRLHWTWQRL